MDTSKKPPGYQIYEEARLMLMYAPPETVGRIMKAAFYYFDRREDPPEVEFFSPTDLNVYGKFKRDADKSWEAYQNICKRNKKAIDARWDKREKKEEPPPQKEKRPALTLTEQQKFENNRLAMIRYFKDSIGS